MSKVELIAEVSSNHGGDLALAKEFIWRFAEAGADWVKFQTTRVKHLSPADPQYAWFQQAEVSDEAHVELKAECQKAGVKFLTTVYNVAEVPMLAALGLEAVKVGSGEAREAALLDALVEQTNGLIIVSDGIVPRLFRYHELWPRVRTLKCISRYPAPHGMVPQDFGLREHDGWSDHCVGLESCHVAILRGASIIEKHVCLPHQARPVKPYEATVEEFKQLRAFADEDPQRFLGRWQHA